MSEFSSPVQNVTFASNGDAAYGYLALPASGNGPGVIVIQEWWGLTTHMADMADRLAGEGYVALAPDLYGGATTHDEGEALQLLLDLPVDGRPVTFAGRSIICSRGTRWSARQSVSSGFVWVARSPYNSRSKRGPISPRWWPSTRSGTCQTTTRGCRRPC